MFLRNNKAGFSINYQSNNRRRAYRIKPNSNDFSLTVNGQPARLETLSATGLSFYMDTTIDPESITHAELCLPTVHHYPLQLALQLIDCIEHKYRCELTTDPQSFKRLCNYLVRHQLTEIRKMQKKQKISK